MIFIDDLWVILYGKVYDLTQFLPEHPGGQKIILKVWYGIFYVSWFLQNN